MRIEWVCILPKCREVMISFQWWSSSNYYNHHLSRPQSWEFHWKPAPACSPLKNKILQILNQPLTARRPQLFQPHLHCGFLFLDKPPRSVEHQDPHVRVWAKVIMIILPTGIIGQVPRVSLGTWLWTSWSSSLLYPEDHDHTVRLKSWYHLYHDH